MADFTNNGTCGSNIFLLIRCIARHQMHSVYMLCVAHQILKSLPFHVNSSLPTFACVSFIILTIVFNVDEISTATHDKLEEYHQLVLYKPGLKPNISQTSKPINKCTIVKYKSHTAERCLFSGKHKSVNNFEHKKGFYISVLTSQCYYWTPYPSILSSPPIEACLHQFQ